MDRRSFLTATGAAVILPAAKGRAYPRAGAVPAVPSPLQSFAGAGLRMVSMPVGGIGTGGIGIGGRGQLRDFQIYNRSNKDGAPDNAFAAIFARAVGQRPIAKVLEATLQPPYEGWKGVPGRNFPGLPRMDAARFDNAFPFARIAFDDADLPVTVTLEAFSPFYPLDADASGLPVAVLRYGVRNRSATSVDLSIALSLDNPVPGDAATSMPKTKAGIDGLLMSNAKLASADPRNGTFALVVADGQPGETHSLSGWDKAVGWNPALPFWDRFSAAGEVGPEPAQPNQTSTLCNRQRLAAGAETHVTFLLAWYFPNRTPAASGWPAADDGDAALLGNHYAMRFADAWAVAAHTARNLLTLERDTRRFSEALARSTLPAPVLQAAASNLTTLVSPTCFRTADGAFYGFEGNMPEPAGGFGNCTHVWNYETATAHLFPELSRSMRETAFGPTALGADGLMDFRQYARTQHKRFGKAAADGQMGQLVRLYLDYRLSGDDAWLRSLWPAAKRAMGFAWIEGGWDPERSGIMTGVQHTTYDVELYGPNPLCTIWYLAALHACATMADFVDDRAFARECREIAARGSAAIDRTLFNGRHYVQKVQPIAADAVATGLRLGWGARDPLHPDYQVGDGCLVDQLAGQYLADAAGLGAVVSPANAETAIRSIITDNRRAPLREHASVLRTFALNDEAGLVICDYRRGGRPAKPFPYFSEVMTGFEYQAAALAIRRGMVDEGVRTVADVRRRYDGERRNPFDEAEYGHNYARAMASWSVLLALSGFDYDGRRAHLDFAPPVLRQGFCCFWSTASGWGTVEWTGAKRFRLRVDHGTVVLRSLRVQGLTPRFATLDDQPLATSIKGDLVGFGDALGVGRDRSLEVW